MSTRRHLSGVNGLFDFMIFLQIHEFVDELIARGLFGLLVEMQDGG
jgi:hypothetical protein